MTPHEFIAKWQQVTLSERSACQQHFLDLCELLGQPKPAAAAKELDTLRNNWLNPPEWTRVETLEFPGSADGPWARYVGNATENNRGFTPPARHETRPASGGCKPPVSSARPNENERGTTIENNPNENERETTIENNGGFTPPARQYETQSRIGTVRYPRVVPKDDECAKLLKKRTLTNLYNERPTWLDLAHKKLDLAVFAAYGWDPAMSDDDLLAALLTLNLERAKGERGV